MWRGAGGVGGGIGRGRGPEVGVAFDQLSSSVKVRFMDESDNLASKGFFIIGIYTKHWAWQREIVEMLL